MTIDSRSSSLARPASGSVAPRARAAEPAAATLEALYRRWEQLRLERDEVAREQVLAQRRLDEQGAFLLGTVRAASEASQASQASEATPGDGSPGAASALQASGTLAHFVGQAEARIARSRAALDEATGARLAKLEAGLAQAEAAVVTALGRYASLAAPQVTLLRRSLPGGQAMLHLARPAPDAAVLLARLLSGKVPTVHGFLFDEATDDPLREPPMLYPHEGISDARTRPTPAEWRALLSGEERQALPLRGVIPFLVPTPAGPALLQWRMRGPVLELEWEAGAGFRSILSSEEAEWAAGALLRLQLAGMLELELGAD